MCRLFAAFSSNNLDAENLLSGASQSLLRQSYIDRKRKQGDGWGVGWFEHGKPKIFKSSRPMYSDRKRVRRAAERARGKALVAHVRWASNPLKLKRGELIGLAHTQPFTHGKWLFAHNGTLYIPKEVAAELGPWKKFIKGKNDSEVLFYWLLKHLVRRPTSGVRRRTSDLGRRTASAILGLHRIWDTCKKSYPIHRYPFHGLNWVLTDGQTLLAFCYTDPRGYGKSKALCNPKQTYYKLRRIVTKDAVIVASEPLNNEPGWHGFRHGELLMAYRVGKQIVSRNVQVL